MSSPDPSRYKSRLFNFLNRQSLRWRDRLIATAQHLRVAVEWGTQILIYPIYLMVQAGRTTQQQLNQTFKLATLPSQTTVDRPLEKVLEKAEHCLNETETFANQNQKNTSSLINNATKLRQKIKESFLDPNLVLETIEENNKNLPILIQGMASNVDNHNLVLVDENNKTLDIFSKTQQTYLNTQIRLETANYWYDLKKTKAKTKTKLISTVSLDRGHILPPIRWFWKTMRWVQTSPVAIAINLFNESSLVHCPMTNSQMSSRVIQFDNHVYYRDNGTSETSSTNIGQLRQLIQQAIYYFFREPSQDEIAPSSNTNQRLIDTSDSLKLSEKPSLKILPSRQTLSKLAQTPPTKSVQKWGQKLEKQDHNSDPFRLQVLIYAAIDYFFGKSRQTYQIEENKKKADCNLGELPQNISNYPQIEDPWLSWDDLYGETSPLTTNNSNLSSPASSPQTVKVFYNSEQGQRKQIKKPLKISKNLNYSAKRQTAKKSSAKPPKANKSVSNSTSVERYYPDHSTDIEASPQDWIETEAKSTGYVKHPLERVLEWLDFAVHWLEEWSAKLWRWLRKRF
ncbi:MAG: hypothetical protein AAGF26_13095 [Cyanobacteria bacterium P01_G01_bin.49]